MNEIKLIPYEHKVILIANNNKKVLKYHFSFNYQDIINDIENTINPITTYTLKINDYYKNNNGEIIKYGKQRTYKIDKSDTFIKLKEDYDLLRDIIYYELDLDIDSMVFNREGFIENVKTQLHKIEDLITKFKTKYKNIIKE